MDASEHLRRLAQARTRHGKASDEYALAVADFVERLVDPRTGEILGIEQATCPLCRVWSGLLGVALRFVAGCAECHDTGLACLGCANSGWVRRYPQGVDPDDLSNTRIPTLTRCLVCTTSGTEGRFERDGLRAIQDLARYYRPGE